MPPLMAGNRTAGRSGNAKLLTMSDDA